MKIALATDHAGFEPLKEIREFLESEGHDCDDFGPKNFDKDDDYPDFIFKAAAAVASGTFDKGVILGGSGQGEAIAANRLNGIRCAVFYGTAVAKKAVDAEGHFNHDPYEIIRLSREHNDANMLSLAPRFLTMQEMKHALKLWLATDFSGESRHRRRIEQLDRPI